MNSDSNKIALFRIGYTAGGYPFNAHAFIADVPSGDVKALTFSGPRKLPTTTDEDHPSSVLAGTPYYDFNLKQVSWPCHGGPHAASDYTVINLWHVEQHFQVSSIEHLPLKANHLSAPSVIPENGRVAVGVAERNLAFANKPEALTMARYIDGKWATVPFKSTEPGPVGRAAVLYKPPRDDLRSIFYFRADNTPSNILRIDQIRESNFDKVRGENSMRWEHFTIDLGFQLQGQYAVIALYDEEAYKHKLYIFEAHPAHQGVNYAYIPLRKDGSIDLPVGEVVPAMGRQNLRATVGRRETPIKVLESGGNILLLGEEWIGSEERIFCHSGKVRGNAIAPDANQWAEVQVAFETKKAWFNDRRFSYSAVIVAGDFA